MSVGREFSFVGKDAIVSPLSEENFPMSLIEPLSVFFQQGFRQQRGGQMRTLPEVVFPFFNEESIPYQLVLQQSLEGIRFAIRQEGGARIYKDPSTAEFRTLLKIAIFHATVEIEGESERVHLTRFGTETFSYRRSLKQYAQR